MEQGAGLHRELFGIARDLVRAADELPKPNEQALREYTDAQLPALKQQLLQHRANLRRAGDRAPDASLTKLREELRRG